MNTPQSYAAHLATYIASPTKIEALTRLEFASAPPLHIIARMRLRVERAAKRPRRSLYCKDTATHDGDDFRPRSLVQIEKPKRVKLPPIKFPPPVYVPPGEAAKPMPRSLIGSIAKAFGITQQQVIRKDRDPLVKRARQTVYAVLRAKGFSYAQIGRWMKRDHTTVLYGVKTFDAHAALFPKMHEIFARFTGQ